MRLEKSLFEAQTNQSGYEPLNLENGSSVNSDNLNPLTWGFNLEVKLKFKPTGKTQR